MGDDFDFYGKGLDGYVHYKQSFDSINESMNEGNAGTDDETAADSEEPEEDFDEYAEAPKNTSGGQTAPQIKAEENVKETPGGCSRILFWFVVLIVAVIVLYCLGFR